VAEPDPERGEFAFQRDPAAAAVKAGEDGAVAGEHPLGPAVAGHRGVQVCRDVAGLEDRPGGGAGQQPGVIVDDVEDLGLAAAGERPVGDAGLPELVGQAGLEPVPGRAGPLVRLGSDKAAAGQDPPDRRHRRRGARLLAQVPGDGLRTRVMTSFGQVLAQRHDRVLDGLAGPLRAGMRTA
jgi:hypothetical protein